MKNQEIKQRLLILSGALNIGLLSTLIYLAVHKSESMQKPLQEACVFTNAQILQTYRDLSFNDLELRLESTELIEEGYTKRDLALACLVAFHYIDIDRALGGIPLQRRVLSFSEKESVQEIIVFPGLHEAHFAGVLRFLKEERWPLTTEGLFIALKEPSVHDPSLVEAFYCTSEFHSLELLVQKFIPNSSRAALLRMLQEGSFMHMMRIAENLRSDQSYTKEQFYHMMLLYALDAKVKIAADYLITHEEEYVLKRCDDAELLGLLALYQETPQKVEHLAKALLISPRCDAMRAQAAKIIYALAKEPRESLLQHVCVNEMSQESKVVQKRTHVVQERDSLWKIARKYGVTIEMLRQCNQLTTDVLRVGKVLEIPEMAQ